MPFTAIITTTKPSDKVFFGQAAFENKAKQEVIRTWTAQQPGFVTQYGPDFIDENTREQGTVWETEQDYLNYAEARSLLPEQIERNNYNLANQITSTTVTK